MTLNIANTVTILSMYMCNIIWPTVFSVQKVTC